jgi:hypothetical protein
MYPISKYKTTSRKTAATYKKDFRFFSEVARERGCVQQDRRLGLGFANEPERTNAKHTRSIHRRTSISGTTFSGKKCLSGTIFHAI